MNEDEDHDNDEQMEDQDYYDENEDVIEDEDPDPDDDGDEVLLQKQCWCNGRRLKYERAAKWVHISQGQTVQFLSNREILRFKPARRYIYRVIFYYCPQPLSSIKF